MGRPRLFRTSSHAYHVTVRSNNREWFHIPIKETWEVLCFCLGRSALRYGAEIHTMVLMSNHFHLLLTTPNKNLDDVMRYFLAEATRHISIRAKRENHIFGARYKPTLVPDAHALGYVYKYICRNPVRAGICESVENYPYSTLNSLPWSLPIVEGFDSYWSAIPKNREERLRWLNELTPKEQEELVGRALRRFEFQFSKTASLQAPLKRLHESYLVNVP